jgi:hypothetical protein
MLAKSALHDVGTSFFKRPYEVVSWEFRSSCIVTINIGARRNLNMIVIVDQHPNNEIC